MIFALGSTMFLLRLYSVRITSLRSNVPRGMFPSFLMNYFALHQYRVRLIRLRFSLSVFFALGFKRRTCHLGVVYVQGRVSKLCFFSLVTISSGGRRVSYGDFKITKRVRGNFQYRLCGQFRRLCHTSTTQEVRCGGVMFLI